MSIKEGQVQKVRINVKWLQKKKIKVKQDFSIEFANATSQRTVNARRHIHFL